LAVTRPTRGRAPVDASQNSTVEFCGLPLVNARLVNSEPTGRTARSYRSGARKTDWATTAKTRKASLAAKFCANGTDERTGPRLPQVPYPSLTAPHLIYRLYRSNQVPKAPLQTPSWSFVERHVNYSEANGHDREHHQVVRQHKRSLVVRNVGSEIRSWDDQEDPRTNAREQIRRFAY